MYEILLKTCIEQNGFSVAFILCETYVLQDGGSLDKIVFSHLHSKLCYKYHVLKNPRPVIDLTDGLRLGHFHKTPVTPTTREERRRARYRKLWTKFGQKPRGNQLVTRLKMRKGRVVREWRKNVQKTLLRSLPFALRLNRQR